MTSPTELQIAERRLERLTKDHEKSMARLVDQIDQEKEGPNRADVLENLEGRRAANEAAYKTYSGQINGEVARMKAELKEVEAKKQAHGRAQLDKAKAKAQREWLSNGGDLAAFEQAWPAMEAQILQDKTLAAVNGTARQPIIRSL